MTYVLLIYRASGPSEVDEKTGLGAHRALQREASERGDLHAVARLDVPERARTVKWTGSGHDVTDGPYIEAKEWLVGLYLVDCATYEEAVARARSICLDASHVVEVRPATWRWQA